MATREPRKPSPKPTPAPEAVEQPDTGRELADIKAAPIVRQDATVALLDTRP